VSAAPPIPLWRRVFAPVGHPSALADAHGFLQTRVTLYSRTLFWFLAGFTVAGVVKLLAMGHVRPDLFRFNLLSLAIFAALAVTIGLDWWFLSRRTRPLWVLHTYESIGTVGVCGAIGLLVFTMPEELPEMVVVFGLDLILVIRAAIVPSTALRTIAVGLASSALATIFVWIRVHDVDPADDFVRAFSWITTLAWGVIFAVATAVVSRVIYGLQETARAAMKLGQYDLEAKLGEGGMGTVYLARHALLRRPTAVKMLSPEAAGEQAVKRFEREVKETARLTHPNVIEIYDYGHTPEGVFYYAMEYLDGLDLEEMVALHGTLPPGRVVYLMSQAAHALAEAHSVGLIHRDIKPANIMLCDRGGVADMVKVVDFGLVKDIQAPAAPQLSQANTVTGTPHYMAPEAILSSDGIDGRADLYGLGCTAYFLLTGRTVFDGSSLVEVCAKHLHTQPVPPTAIDPSIPPDLERVVLRCLAKDRADRHDDALALWHALRQCKSARDWDQERASAWWAEHGPSIRVRRLRAHEAVERSDTLAVAFDRRSPPDHAVTVAPTRRAGGGA